MPWSWVGSESEIRLIPSQMKALLATQGSKQEKELLILEPGLGLGARARG